MQEETGISSHWESEAMLPGDRQNPQHSLDPGIATRQLNVKILLNLPQSMRGRVF
jgi:hypothetical protein